MNCLCFGGGQSKSSNQQTIDEVVSGKCNVKFYTFKQLRFATQNFSPAKKIGEGGFGSVYKGRLLDGNEVAVKVLSAESRQGLPEFLTELGTIANVEHPNLVKLYGFCVEGNNRILVYGYLENNSLAHTLLGGNSNIKFSWETRKGIAIGVAKGLAYLHEELRPHIIHRDIKASNILLDKELNARISDFGLAKLIAPSMTHVSTRVAGTLGYLAPEYAVHGHLNRKADIYSYGVLLLEIITGCRSRDRCQPDEEQYLLQRAWNSYENGEPSELIHLVSESLRKDINVEEACKFFKVALLCTQGIPKFRPSMSTVIQMLQGDVDITEVEVSKPGLLSEMMNSRSKEGKKGNPFFSPRTGSSDTPSNSEPSSTYPSLTITTISQRS